MKSLFLCSIAVLGWSVTGSAAEQTLNGKISDSMCNETHKTQAEHAKANMSDRDCTLACIKNGGKYVFIADNKTYDIDNQTFSDLKKHAGHDVKMTGDVKGKSITVSKIQMEKSPNRTSE